MTVRGTAGCQTAQRGLPDPQDWLDRGMLIYIRPETQQWQEVDTVDYVETLVRYYRTAIAGRKAKLWARFQAAEWTKRMEFRSRIVRWHTTTGYRMHIKIMLSSSISQWIYVWDLRRAFFFTPRTKVLVSCCVSRSAFTSALASAWILREFCQNARTGNSVTAPVAAKIAVAMLPAAVMTLAGKGTEIHAIDFQLGNLRKGTHKGKALAFLLAWQAQSPSCYWPLLMVQQPTANDDIQSTSRWQGRFPWGRTIKGHLDTVPFSLSVYENLWKKSGFELR